MVGDVVDDTSLSSRQPITAETIAEAHRLLAEMMRHFPAVELLPFPLSPGYEDRLSRYLQRS